MIIQLIIVAIFIIIGLAYIGMEHHGRKFKIVVIAIICFLLYLSMMNILSSEEIDLTSPRGIVNGIYIYFGWIGRTSSALWDVGGDTVHMVGNAIKIENSTEDKESQKQQSRIRR